MMVPENGRDLVGRAVTSSDPDDLRRVPEKEAPLVKIGVLRDNREALLDRVLPYGIVIGSLKADLADVR